MTLPTSPRLALLASSALALRRHPALAQVTLRPDGQWRRLMTEGLNVDSGLRLRHTSQSAAGLRRLDAALVTGLVVRFD